MRVCKKKSIKIQDYLEKREDCSLSSFKNIFYFVPETEPESSFKALTFL